MDRADGGIRRVPLSPRRYDERWEALAATGADIHGEVDLVAALVGPTGGLPVLDGGCGTGRVAIELSRRGYDTVGVDVDVDLLARAREKAPTLPWIEGNLATLPATTAPGPFAAAVLAGNVMIFVAPGSEGAVLRNLSDRLGPGGLVVAGFQLSGRLSPDEYDAHATAAGLAAEERWSTWARAPFTATSDYVVVVHSLASKR
jgi:SAM-dependent methyltransferase